jgi:hypothetical protein
LKGPDVESGIKIGQQLQLYQEVKHKELN